MAARNQPGARIKDRGAHSVEARNYGVGLAGAAVPLSASFGVAACPESSRSLDNLPAQADSALYVAKRSGRNRVEKAGR